MANITTNLDIDYIQKDFNSTVDAIITFANVNYGPGTSANRLWTDFNADSFSRNWLEIVAFVADVFFFYFDNQATQSYLQTATLQSAIRNIAKQFGFTPASATSSSGVASFTVTGAGTISRGYRVAASNGAPFYVTNDITAISAGTVSGNVLQGTIVTEQFTAQGLQNEEFDLQGPNVVVDKTNLNPLDISPQLTVGGNAYTLVSTTINNNGTDSAAVTDSLGNVIGGGGRVFTLDERPDGTPFITFGDGIFGRKLSSGELITITYRSGGGSVGNITKQTLNTLIDSNPIVSSVNNAADFSGGADEQSIDQLRQLIPASLRTLDRAVAAQDYSDLLVANFSQVFAASAEANLTQPGIDLNIYVVPQGIGITSIVDNVSLKNTLSSFIDRRKMVTTQFQILDAFGVDTLISLEVFIADTASKTNVTRAIQTALTDYFSLTTGGSSGAGIGFAAQILLKDINNLIETITGIDRFEIKRLTYRPRVQETVIGLVSSYNVSPVQIYPNIEQVEWLLAASGPQTRAPGNVLFDNTSLIAFTYTSGTGVIQYAFPVDLSKVAPGDQFRDHTGTLFTILAVDTTANNVTLSESLTVSTTVSSHLDGQIQSGETVYESFKCFKKILANATNLSIDSITDINLDLSVLSGTGAAVSPRLLLDNVNVFIPNQYATGAFFLVDASGNIWQIVSNDSSSIKTGISAINDASIVAVSSGDYKIVQNMTGRQIVFQNNIFNVQYNSDNTLVSTGAEFSQIGTIGDAFAISQLQNNLGNLGVPVDLISYDPSTGRVRLNSSPDLTGVNSSYVLIDSSGQIFNITSADDISHPSVFYDVSHLNDSYVLNAAGIGQQIGEGFKVGSTDLYAVVSLQLQRKGNILGNLTLKIVNDSGGLPNISSIVAVSTPVSVTSLTADAFSEVLFSFTTPPSLTAATQYHLVLSADAAYSSAEVNGVKAYDNTGLISFTYNSLTGVVQYASTVNLTSVKPGHYFRDSAGNYFKVLAVDTTGNNVTIPTAQSVDTSVPSNSDKGAIYVYDLVESGLNTGGPTYADGQFSRFDGTSWSNATLGPSPSGTQQTMIFTVEGTKSVKVDSNLTPVTGPGATLSTRYYDDNNEMSLIVGLSAGSITFAADANALAKGTVASVANRPVDNFVFRSSTYADDIVNLRLNEIPQIKTTDIGIQIFGGVD